MSTKEVQRVVAIEEAAYRSGIYDGQNDYAWYSTGRSVSATGFIEAQVMGELVEEIIPGCGKDVQEHYNRGYKNGAEMASW